MCVRARAAIFVQIGAENFSEMCVRVRAYITFKVRTCARTSARPFLATKFCFEFLFGKSPKLKKNIFFRIFFCACGCKNWGAGACVRSYENLCDVRAGADKNPRTLKVWPLA